MMNERGELVESGRVRRRRVGLSAVVGLIASFGMLLIVFVEAPAESPVGKKRFPPYPDVWGIELPYPAPGDRRAISGVFRLEDGDIGIIVIRRAYQSTRRDGTCCDRWFDYGLVELFKQTSVSLTMQQFVDFSERNRKLHIDAPLGGRIVLSDGTLVEGRLNYHNRCFAQGVARVLLRGRTENLLRDVHLFYLRDDVRNRPQNEECEGAGGAAFVRLRVEELAPIFIALGDDTFLVQDFGGNILVRFDSDLRTKVRLNERLFMVDRQDVEHLYSATVRERVPNQAFHDALLTFLLKRKHDKKE